MAEKKRAARKKPQERFFRRLFPRYENTSVDLTFLVMVILLLVFGLVMMFSASYISAKYDAATGYDATYYIKRQLGFALVGVALMFAISKINLLLQKDK